MVKHRPEELLDEIRAEAAERGLSAYVAEALRFKRDRDRLLELADWLQEEHGPVTEDERAAAFQSWKTSTPNTGSRLSVSSY